MPKCCKTNGKLSFWGVPSAGCCAPWKALSPGHTFSQTLQNTIFAERAPPGGLQNTIFAERTPPGGLQGAVFAARTLPGAFQNTSFAERAPPGGAHCLHPALATIWQTLHTALEPWIHPPMHSSSLVSTVHSSMRPSMAAPSIGIAGPCRQPVCCGVKRSTSGRPFISRGMQHQNRSHTDCTLQPLQPLHQISHLSALKGLSGIREAVTIPFLYVLLKHEH